MTRVDSTIAAASLGSGQCKPLPPEKAAQFYADACKREEQERMAACPCACHANRCGSADIAMAHHALRLIERCSTPAYVDEIDVLVQRAGPDFAIEALARLKERDTLDTEVPF